MTPWWASWWLVVVAALGIALGTGCGSSGEAHAGAADAPVELGQVDWRRGYDAARAHAREVGRPVLVLFDEIPGCSTVRAYGAGTLSDPLVVEAAERLFVPVVVQNNVGGDDRRVLESFGEPAWNNPVVRFVSAEGQELAPRLTGDWRRGALLARMVTALRAAGRPVPDWLALVAREDMATTRTATYAMACFWSGEAHLGGHDGVLATRTGFAGGREVVQLEYDPGTVSLDALDAYAARAGEGRVAGSGFRPSPNDDRYQIRRTSWAQVPMTAAQASRVNAAVGGGEDPARWLSPGQRAQAGR